MNPVGIAPHEATPGTELIGGMVLSICGGRDQISFHLLCKRCGMRYYPDPAPAISMADLIPVIRNTFRDHATGSCIMPPKSYVMLPKGDFRVMPAYLPSMKTAGMKLVNVHPGNDQAGLPTVMAEIILLDPDTGMPVAILNGTGLTALRTGASAAVATEALCPKKSGSIGIIGAGRQAEYGLMAIREVFRPEEIRVWSRREASVDRFIARFPEEDIHQASLPGAADTDVLLTVTPSTVPLIRNEWIHDGTHINAMGADAPGKQELDPAILNRAEVFVDDMAQAIHSGEINVPVREGVFEPASVQGTLGEVLIQKNSRIRADSVTVFDSTGIAITDLATAVLALDTAFSIGIPFPVQTGR